MRINKLSNYNQSGLPNIDLVHSEPEFKEAFVAAAQILHQHLKRLESALENNRDFTTAADFNLVILGLFSKMCRHYYSYVWLEVQEDWLASQLVIEHFWSAAITLIYLLEEGDEALLSEYIAASVQQVRDLLIDIDQQLQQFPDHPDLIRLRKQLEQLTLKQQSAKTSATTTDTQPYLWGRQTVNTTAKRSSVIGLKSLTNPARQIILRVIPASWLDLKLFSSAPVNTNPFRTQSTTNFTSLRDAAHLCLHATQILLEDINHQEISFANLERQQENLNVLYEWFYNAYHSYELRAVTNSLQR